jgi:hypothetical protein
MREDAIGDGVEPRERSVTVGDLVDATPGDEECIGHSVGDL